MVLSQSSLLHTHLCLKLLDSFLSLPLFALDFWSAVVLTQLFFFAGSDNHVEIKAFKSGTECNH